jgi:RimJ/RimL family protein N-acetyltransferase
MNYPPYKIKTDRLVIRCYNPEDAKLLKSSIDKNISYLQPWMPWALNEPTSIDEKIELLRLFRSNFDSSKDFCYGIFDETEKYLIGGTGLHTKNGKDVFEIGYWIAEEYSTNGYATEVAKSLVIAGLSVNGIDRIEIHCDPRNIRSSKIPEKLGFSLECIRKRIYTKFPNEFRDSMVWTLFKSENEKYDYKLTLHMFDAEGSIIVK